MNTETMNSETSAQATREREDLAKNDITEVADLLVDDEAATQLKGGPFLFRPAIQKVR